MSSFPEPVRGEIRYVYKEAFWLVFLCGVAFGGAAVVQFWFETDIHLRGSLETEYGLEGHNTDIESNAEGQDSVRENRSKMNARTVS